MKNYEEKCKPSDYPLIGESLISFYNSRKIYLQDRTFENQILAENDMYSAFYLAKGYMSMGSITEEKFQFIKKHLEEGLDD